MSLDDSKGWLFCEHKLILINYLIFVFIATNYKDIYELSIFRVLASSEYGGVSIGFKLRIVIGLNLGISTSLLSEIQMFVPAFHYSCTISRSPDLLI